jgi:hypothetical protein
MCIQHILYNIECNITNSLFRTTTNVCDAMRNSCCSGSWKSRRMSEAAYWKQRTSKLRTTAGGEHVSMYSMNSILLERVGVGEAPNSHYLLYFIQHHKLFYLSNRLRALKTIRVRQR